MARTINAIFDEMIIEKETFASLDGLESPVTPDTAQLMLTELTTASKVSLWRLFFWVVAFAIFTHEKLFDSFVTEIEQAAKDAIPGTARWYVIESLKFQFGDNLEFDIVTEKFIYEDTTSVAALAKQIIEVASTRDVNQDVTIRVAKSDGAGGIEKLSGSELTAFTAYVDEFKFAGTKTITISDDPDLLKMAYTVEYDPQVLKADGTTILDGTSPVQEAIDAYIEGLPFDSIFRVQDLTDAIQAATGVVNAVADVVDTKFAALPYASVLTTITESYLPNAGYLETDPSPIVVLTPADYDSTLPYVIGDQVRQDGIVFEANANLGPEAFDSTKWDTLSNITYISV